MFIFAHTYTQTEKMRRMRNAVEVQRIMLTLSSPTGAINANLAATKRYGSHATTGRKKYSRHQCMVLAMKVLASIKKIPE